MEKRIIISKLDVNTLMHSDVLWGYYQREWRFSAINYNDTYINIPILQDASHSIEEQGRLNKLKYPWMAYIDGFLSEYNRPLPTDVDLTLHLSQIQPTPPVPFAPAGFSDSSAINYGVTMARAFKVWEYVIQQLPAFEKLLTTKPAFEEGLGSNFDDKILGEVFDRLEEEGWFKGQKSHFIAIFRPEPAPKGWQPIEYKKCKGKYPHKGALANLVYTLSSKWGSKQLPYNGFFAVNGSPYEVDTDRKAYNNLSSDLGTDLSIRLGVVMQK